MLLLLFVVFCCCCCRRWWRRRCHRHRTPVRLCPLFDKGVHLAMVWCLFPQVKMGGGPQNLTHFCSSHKVRSRGPIWRPAAEGQIYLIVQTESSVGGDGASPQYIVLRMLHLNIQWAKTNWSAIVVIIMVVMVMVTILITLFIIIMFVTYTV